MKRNKLTTLAAAVAMSAMVNTAFPLFVYAEVTTDVGQAVNDAGITVDELHEAGAYFKSASESGAIDEFETEYKFAAACAELGNGNAMLWLGELYQGHKIAEADKVDDPVAVAMEWWEKAGENGEPRGYANIGLLYQHKSVPGGGNDYGNVELNNETAFEYFAKGSDAGDSKSPRYVGICYEEGNGVDQNLEKAFEYFSLAAERGDSTGQVKYADYLLEGTVVNQNADEAISVYQGIVDNNGHDLVSCALKLGNIFKDGAYVEQDLEKAAFYYEIVLANAEEGSEEATTAQAALDDIQ